MPRISIESGPLRGRTLSLPPDRRVGIGRGTECFLPLSDQLVSRLHCEIVPHKGRFVLLDRGSRNGTQLNRTRIDKAVLKPGDMIRVGTTFMSFLGDGVDPLLDRTIAGYRIVERIGRGGMGTVYRATQVALKRDVAFKVLSPELGSDPAFVEQFLTEARSAAKLDHPNVVRVFDVGSKGDIHFLSMEFMEGGTLQQLLDTKGCLDPRRALTCMLDATEALIWAEESGIVHRDIKPDNLMFDNAGRLKIGDFGIASDRSLSKTIYREGSVIGTPHHMSPEQAEGRLVDHRTDLYALGSTLYVALTGKTPYEGEAAIDVLLKKVRNSPPPIPVGRLVPNLPPEVDTLVFGLMAHAPENRFQSAEEAQRVIHDVLDEMDREMDRAAGDAAAASPRAVSKGGGRRPSRRALVGAGAALALVLALIVGWALWPDRGPATPAEVATGREPSGSGSEGGPAVHAPPAVEVVRVTPPAPSGDGGAKPADADALASPATESPSATAGDGASGKTTTPAVPTIDPWSDGPEAQRAREALKTVLAGFTGGATSERDAHRELEALRTQLGTPWRDIIDDVSSQIESRSHAAFEVFTANELAPLLEGGELGKAHETIVAYLDEHPFAAAAARPRLDDIEKSSRELFDARRKASGELEASGDLDGAIELLSNVLPLLPEALRIDAESEREAIATRRAALESSLERLDAMQNAMTALCKKLDFDGAANALVDDSLSSSPSVRHRHDVLVRELEAFRAAYKALAAQVEELAGKSSYVPLPLQSDPRGEDIRRRVRALRGLEFESQVRGRSLETHGIAEIRDDRLLELAGTALPERAEAVACVAAFLRVCAGPLRALELVRRHDRDDRHRELAERLRRELTGTTYGDFFRLMRDIEPLRSAARAGAPPQPAAWRETLARAEELVRAAVLVDRPALRADVGRTYVECWIGAGAARPLAELFAGKFSEKRSRRADGPPLSRLVYDFKTEEQLADFHALGKGTVRWRRGALLVTGDARLLNGDVFRGSLEVSGVAGGYDPARPDLRVALWSQPTDLPSTVGASYSSLNDGSDLTAPSSLLFGLGYYGPTGSSINGVPYLTIAGRETILPANVILAAGNRRGGSVRSPALWARRPARGYRDTMPFEIAAATAEGRLGWSVGGDRYAPKEFEHLLLPDDPIGSVTLASPGREIWFSSLVVEGELDPMWIEEELTRRASAALVGLDPTWPVKNVSGTLESMPRKGVLAQRRAPALYDPFDGKATLAWDIVEDDPPNRSFDALPGALTINTQRGTIAGAENEVKNLHLTASPAGLDEFDVLTRLVRFKPSSSYQQAGLVCYDSSDNFIMAVYRRNLGDREFLLQSETGGAQASERAPASESPSTVWLRLRKRGTSYTFSTSFDGITFSHVGQLEWGNGKPSRVGILAVNGRRDASSRAASFDFFAVTPLR